MVYWNVYVSQSEESLGNRQSSLTTMLSFITPVKRLTRTTTDPLGSTFYWRYVEQGITGIINIYKLIRYVRP